MPNDRDEWVEVGSPKWRALLEQHGHGKPRWRRWAGVIAVVVLVGHSVYLQQRQTEDRATLMVRLGELTALTELAAERAGSGSR